MQKRQKRSKKTVVMTGGHAGTTALSVLEEVRKRDLGWEVCWIGPRKAVEGKSVLTIEAKIFPKLGVKFYPIVAGKLQRKLTRHTIFSILKVPFGFFHAFTLLKKIRPDSVISFGGYAGVPVVVAAYFLKIPAVLQEQITGLGFANRISAPFAKKIALSRREGLAFSRGKGVVLGNPVRSSFTKVKKKTKIGAPPCIFIFPGSRGSQMINAVVKSILPKLLDDFSVIHYTGSIDYKKFQKVRSKLTSASRKRYEVFNFIEPKKVVSFFENADILIGRAGANTVSELMVVGTPSILIPLTWTNYQEQVLNARAVEKRGLAKVIEQKNLTGDVLYKKILEVRDNWGEMAGNYKKDLAELDISAASKVVDLMIGVTK